MTLAAESEWESTPGSEEARAAGCACAVIDNHYGRGRGGNGAEYGWYISGDCPVHGARNEHSGC